MDSTITIVSGLPRSGTSLMMQMLVSGGIEAVSDNIREADIDNPKGYLEFEKVKKLKEDSSWIPETRGKVFKMVSQLLYDLPTSEEYRVVFMDRDFDEMLDSQDKMLKRLGRPSAPREDIKRSFRSHLDKLFKWLADQKHIKILRVSYNELIESPEEQIARVVAFLDRRPDAQRMAATIDPNLYRNRKAGPPDPSQPTSP